MEPAAPTPSWHAVERVAEIACEQTLYRHTELDDRRFAETLVVRSTCASSSEIRFSGLWISVVRSGRLEAHSARKTLPYRRARSPQSTVAMRCSVAIFNTRMKL